MMRAMGCEMVIDPAFQRTLPSPTARPRELPVLRRTPFVRQHLAREVRGTPFD